MTCQKVHVDSDVIQAFGGQGKQAKTNTSCLEVAHPQLSHTLYTLKPSTIINTNTLQSNMILNCIMTSLHPSIPAQFSLFNMADYDTPSLLNCMPPFQNRKAFYTNYMIQIFKCERGLIQSYFSFAVFPYPNSSSPRIAAKVPNTSPAAAC